MNVKLMSLPLSPTAENAANVDLGDATYVCVEVGRILGIKVTMNKESGSQNEKTQRKVLIVQSETI